MPRLTQSVPKYRKHKQSGQAVVTLNGRDHLLGPFGTKVSRREYDRLVCEWLQRGRMPLVAPDDGLTIVEAISRYVRHVKRYYVKSGRATAEQDCIRSALRFVNQLYGDTLAEEFSPLALKSVRSKMVEAGLARSTINQHVSRIRRMFKWLASEELLPASTWQSLTVVDGLRKGRTNAKEPKPVRPVDEAIVEATLAQLPEVVADLLRFQLLTGCRPVEACSLRPRDVDRSGSVWLYTPESHKVEHHGRDRVIAIGPQAQAILLRYLARDSEAFCFSPCDSEEKRMAARCEARVTPYSCGNRRGSNRVRRPRRSPGHQYDASSLRHAIHRACDRTFPAPKEVSQDREKLKAWREAHRWSANRLRHSAGTAVRKQFGIEAAQHVLGHARTNMTEVYAEKHVETAARVASIMG